MSTYYNTCPQCGAALDPGEECRCDREPPIDPGKRVVSTLKTDHCVLYRYADGTEKTVLLEGQKDV